jgi:hypothetical protein
MSDIIISFHLLLQLKLLLKNMGLNFYHLTFMLFTVPILGSLVISKLKIRNYFTDFISCTPQTSY